MWNAVVSESRELFFFLFYLESGRKEVLAATERGQGCSCEALQEFA